MKLQVFPVLCYREYIKIMPNEFDRIATHLAPLSAGYDGAFNLSDDVAILDGNGLILSTDTIVQGVHYIGDEPADLIARKLIRCNVSDLAAKGATPKYYTLNLTLNQQQGDDWFALFCKGLGQDQKQYSLTLIGGDSTIIKEGPSVLSMTLFGEAPNGTSLPKRSDAKVGDVVCVSGTIGDAAIGLKYLQGNIVAGDKSATHLVGHYQLPNPRVKLGQELAPLLHASMDISDGLMQDAGHITRNSNVGINIHADALPLFKMR